MSLVVNNIEKWISENEKYFQPPICNKLMHADGNIKCFFVGGPNSRKDFHLEEGEEFFYQMKGSMNLRVVEQGRFKDVIIDEGEVFLLPSRIPHSPQRFAHTLGMVIERERKPNEIDGLRYYIDNSTEILYETWFHCDSLDSQLPPIIQKYFLSEQYRTGKPLPGTILEDKPLKQDFITPVDAPFSLFNWLNENETELRKKGRKQLFRENYSSRITVYGQVPKNYKFDYTSETFLMQLKGSAVVECGSQEYNLKENDTILMNENQVWKLRNNDEGFTLSVAM